MQARLLTIIGILLLGNLTMAQGPHHKGPRRGYKAEVSRGQRTRDDLVLTIWCSPRRIQRGDSMRVKFRLLNRSNRSWYVSKSGKRFGAWTETSRFEQYKPEDVTAYPPASRDDYVLLRPGKSVFITIPELIRLLPGRYIIHGTYWDPYVNQAARVQPKRLQSFYRIEKGKVWTKRVNSAGVSFKVLK